ncbi:MAG: A24 family peptidase, partial [Pirellulales bacterium]
LTVPALGAAILYHAVVGGWQGVGTAMGGFATGFGVLLVLWLIGGAGAGDVKLMGALGAWLGARLTLWAVLLSAFVVAVSAAAYLVYSIARFGAATVRERFGAGTEKAKSTPPAANREPEGEPPILARRRRSIPYALPLAVGTALALFWDLMIL